MKTTTKMTMSASNFRYFGGKPGAHNTYSLSVFRRDHSGIIAVYVAYTAKDAIRVARLLTARYPARLVGLSRIVSSWRPTYESPIGVPDYRGSRKLSLYSRKGRGRRAQWVKRDERPDVFAALAADGVIEAIAADLAKAG